MDGVIVKTMEAAISIASASSQSSSWRASAASLREHLGDARGKLALQIRQQLVADPVPRHREVRVRRVFLIGQTMVGGVLAELGTGQLDQRPDHHPGRSDGSRPGRAVPEPRSSRSRNVSAWSSRLCPTAIAVRVQPLAAASAGTRSGRARGILDRALLRARLRRDVGPPDLDRQRQLRCDLAAERFVVVGGGAAQLVIEVRRAGDSEVAVRLRARAAGAAARPSPAPPDRATSTRPPARQHACRRIVRRTRVGETMKVADLLSGDPPPVGSADETKTMAGRKNGAGAGT